MVYFVQRIDGGEIKIGTTIQLSIRLKQLAKELKKEVRVLAVVEGSYEEENSLHRRFAHLNVVDEMFEPGEDLLRFIAESGEDWDGTDESKMLPVKIDARVLRDARIVCAISCEDVQDYLSRVLGPIIEGDKKEAMAKEQRLMGQR